MISCQLKNNLSVKEQNLYSATSTMVFVMEWKDGLNQISLKTVNMCVELENAQTMKTKTLRITLLVTGPVT